MRKCPFCGSIWVCWNWFRVDDGNYWGHECWCCEDSEFIGMGSSWTTKGKVKTGIPYSVLKAFHSMLCKRCKNE